MARLKDKVREWAIGTRIILLVMQALSNLFLQDHDAEDVFRTPKSEDSPLDGICSFLFGGLANWDGQYFLHVAKYGYTYENCLVFFPLLPSMMMIASNTVAYPVFYLLSEHYGMILIGVCMNVIVFLVSVEVFYELGRHVLRDERLAYYAALLYCINPATVFFTALYSESLFALWSFLGMLMYEKNHHFTSALCFAVGGASRSNGIVSCGFVAYTLLRELNNQRTSLKNSRCLTASVWMASQSFKRLIFGIVNLFIVVSPFLAHQVFAYKTFCLTDSDERFVPPEVEEYGVSQGYHFPHDQPPEWCDQNAFSYSYIQSRYWNVGFLNYYELKQIPNFLLALPIVVCVTVPVRQYFRQNWGYCQNLGLSDEIGTSNKCYKAAGIMNARLFVYMVHAAALTIFGCLFMHIQVITRMLCSSSPIPYWFAATVLARDLPQVVVDLKSRNPDYDDVVASRVESSVNLAKTGENRILDHIQHWTRHPYWDQQLIKGYFLSYFVLGTAMFVNFYPFT